MRKQKSKQKLLAELRAKHLRRVLVTKGLISGEKDGILDRQFERKGDLVGKKVRLIKDDYEMRIKKGSLSESFVAWYQANKDNVFIARLPSDGITRTGIYEFEGVDNWLFSIYDLEEVKEGVV